MGTIVHFQPSTDVRKSAPAAEMGKLLLFTGIRYDRDETDGGDGSASPASGMKRLRGRRRN